MKNKMFCRAAVLSVALFCCLGMSTTAFAQSSEPVAETTPAEEPATPKPFTRRGRKGIFHDHHPQRERVLSGH